jgi:hypothetical protein
LHEGTSNKEERKMVAETKMALAALLVFSSASAALAHSDNRTNHVRGAPSPTKFESRNGAVDHAVKPFTAEEQAWFDRASRNY